MLNLLGTMLGQAAGGAPTGMQQFMPILMIVAMVAIMYFFMIRPQMKQQKEHQNMLANLKKGDKVITAGGVWGVVVGISDSENIVVVRIDENTKVEVAKPYIVAVKKDGAPAAPAVTK